MVKVGVNWHSRPKILYSKDVVLDRFKRYLMGLGLRDETIKLYVGLVGGFLEYAKADEPSVETANAFKDFLIDKRLSRGHINNVCFALKKFYKMNNIDWEFIKLKTNEGLPYYFDEKDVLAIFSVCSNIKHLAMLQTLFYGCLRSSELCKLDDNDLDLKTRTLRLRETKGGRDDIVYINEECADTLKAYLKMKPQIEVGNRIPLFYTDNGNSWTNGDVHRMFIYYKKKAGVTKQGGTHVFSRHTTATLMIAKGCDCRIVKEILRHKDIHTTLRYAHVADKTKRSSYEKYLVL
ncbi:MAG: tyrosine-type recombinase/integrase [Methanothrix sp.]